MMSLNDLLVAGLGLLLFVGLLRLFGIRRISALAVIVLAFLAVLAVSIAWAYFEWRRLQAVPEYRTEWQDGTLEDLNGQPLDPKSFEGPYAE